MQIKINTQHFKLYPKQEESILRKIEHLSHFDCNLQDESTQVKVDLIHEESRSRKDAYRVHVTFFVPQGTLRAESHGDNIETAVDEVIEKLKTQIERYKAKLHHLEKRAPKE